MLILYPGDPLQKGKPDQQFAAEVQAVLAAGFETSVFSLEEFQGGEFRAHPPIVTGTSILYRGWMLSGPEYKRLISALNQLGARALIPTTEYLCNHHLPNWYPLIKDLTPETRIYPPDCDLESELKHLAWPEYF